MHVQVVAVWLRVSSVNTPRIAYYNHLLNHSFTHAGGGGLTALTSGSQDEFHVKHQLPKHRLEQQEHYGKVPLPLQVRPAV
jgi:hypothetical protein